MVNNYRIFPLNINRIIFLATSGARAAEKILTREEKQQNSNIITSMGIEKVLSDRFNIYKKIHHLLHQFSINI